jgi:transaldolase
MADNPLLEVAEHGQSIWLDNISRGMIRDGSLQKLIDEDGISGVTSNPAIFNKAMTQGNDYDDQIRKLGEEGKSTEQIFEIMAIDDIQDACDAFRPVYDRTNGTDGFVSLEVSPHLARDTEGTKNDALRLWKAVNRPNVLIKIPGTPEGIPAIRECLAEGVNVNITLLFSLDAYRSVMEAHLGAMEDRVARGLPLAPVASVASFFLSRIDSKVDKMLDAMKDGEHGAEASALRGTAAIASARVGYEMWQGMYSGDRWQALADAGARYQKPLWASTSTKDDAYSDVLYVETLIGPHTINTLPGETIEAFRDHGKVADTVGDDIEGQHRILARLEAIGVSMQQVTDDLVTEGVKKFVEPYDALITALEEKRKSLSPSGA